jgi:4-hydroxybenzoate polyprenyltransferase
MAGVGYERKLGVLYFAGLAAAAGLVGYQCRLIRGRGREDCFKAFLNNNWLGLAIFAGLALDLFLRVRMRWL